MMKKYIDLHCHPFLEYFENPKEIIEDAHNNGVSKIFLVGTDLKNSIEAIELSNHFDYVFPIIGIHPNDAWDDQDIYKLEKIINSSVVGIGEVGLDYHYEKSPSKEKQKMMFKLQIELAIKNNIPVIVHSRDAHEDTYLIIKEYRENYPQLNFILHSYSSGVAYVEKYVKLGVYFSFSGIITFKNAQDMQEAAKLVPLNLIFCETDTPYLAPVPHRGKTNIPNYVIETTNFIANLKGINLDEMLDAINQNVKRVFTKIN